METFEKTKCWIVKSHACNSDKFITSLYCKLSNNLLYIDYTLKELTDKELLKAKEYIKQYICNEIDNAFQEQITPFKV